ncbi:unnamed protein product [Darwinula stevensoni]|uniref:Uncharacterized protein n=1 Tax=Darwinula stevensoni TaxID=69355 RepID=A0A7R8XE21_9CRUS|nr:unnamed protein product [Darwinula stevensoni]CAG0889213.1 unnamed protein product [Darwinula stevensoni]
METASRVSHMESSTSRVVSSDADYRAWKKFHCWKKVGFFVALCVWIGGLLGVFVCFLLIRSPISFVFLVVALGGMVAIIKMPFLNFDKRYREPRCKGAGVDPHLYMFPNVPYLFVEDETAITLRRTWYVVLPDEATHHANWHTKINCYIHRDAVDAVRGKSWHFNSFAPSPEQGLPPFVLKRIDSGIQSRTDMVEVFLTDSPIVFSRDLNRARSRSLLLPSPWSSRRPNRTRSRSLLPSPRSSKQPNRARTRSLLPFLGSNIQSHPASQFQPEFSKNVKSDLAPSYKNATKKWRRSTTTEQRTSASESLD